MEDPPPVPPKDTPRKSTTDIDVIAASGSKRKRDARDDHHGGLLDVADIDTHSPKRARGSLRHSEPEFSDDASPAQKRNVRRKKGIQNLSTLSLRHAAEQQRQASAGAQSRESRFQEGSLTDKPSAKPPSAYTRFLRTDSGNLQLVDDLMSDYHDGIPTPRDSVDMAVEEERAAMPQRVAEITADNAPRDGNAGLFRFGRSLAANFHPVALWNKIWNETKEELTLKNMEEMERKRRQKLEAEARYAEMKQAGQLGLKQVNRISAAETATPRDSGIVMDSAHTSVDYSGTGLHGQLLALPNDDTTSRAESEAPDTTSKLSRTLKSRLHFKRPSITNLRHGLKRVGSEINLTTHTNRESSSSLSPVKTDADASELRRSHSRVDLKKQHKLSKRVSDLEVKLQTARKELQTALVEASPMPKLGNKYERFTPNSTLKRPKFVPGQLPSLPSERLLDPAQLGLEAEREQGVNLHGARDTPQSEGTSRKGLDLTEEMDIDEDTIRAPRGRPYPPRAASLFKNENENVNTNMAELDTQVKAETMPEHSEIPSGVMDTKDTAEEQRKADASANYAVLDAKLKALDKNVKTAKKAGKGKKRKSASADDGIFKPGKEDDDDSEWEEAKDTPKKRKPNGKKVSPDSKRKGQTTKRQRGKKGDEDSSSPSGKKTTGKQSVPLVEPEQEVFPEADSLAVNDVADDDALLTGRTSLDSIARSLEPLYEEEEESSIIPLNDEPSRPTATATPARYGRPRSTSPAKTMPGAEEALITRAAKAAQHARSSSESRREQRVEVVEEEVVVTQSGADGANAITQMRKQGSFEWPEDVF